MNSRLVVSLAALFLSLVLTQCASRPGGGGAGGWGGSGGAYDPNNPGFQELPQRQEGISLYGPGSENVQLNPVAPVYFAFDSAVVSPNEMSKVQSLAEIARQTLIIIAGHTDSTGTFEYNRGLGERRALAVREELLRMGVPVGNIQTISYGEDMLTGQGDSYDRRAEFGALKAPSAPMAPGPAF